MFPVHAVGMDLNFYDFSDGCPCVCISGPQQDLCVAVDTLIMLLDPSLSGDDAHCSPTQQHEWGTHCLPEKVMEAFQSHPEGTKED
jgi:hypothetical protein